MLLPFTLWPNCIKTTINLYLNDCDGIAWVNMDRCHIYYLKLFISYTQLQCIPVRSRVFATAVHHMIPSAPLPKTVNTLRYKLHDELDFNTINLPTHVTDIEFISCEKLKLSSLPMHVKKLYLSYDCCRNSSVDLTNSNLETIAIQQIYRLGR
jgi:hypothetical protein